MALLGPRRHGRAAFAFIFVTVLLDMLAIGIITPILPRLLIQFEHGNVSTAAAAAGTFAFVWAAMQFLFSPAIGAISDRVGRRPVVLVSNFGLGVDYLLMALAPTLNWLFVGRVLSGITAASLPTATAYIADITPENERAAKFGLLGAAFGLGFILGPALGGVLGDMDLRYPFWAAAGLSLANGLYGLLILPESLPREHRSAFRLSKANPIASLRLLRSHPQLLGLGVASFFYYIAHQSLPSLFPIYTFYRYQWTEALTGLVLAGVGIFSTVVSAVVVAYATRRFGELRTFFAGLFFGATGLSLFAVAPTSAPVLVGCLFIALFQMAGPALQGTMSRLVGHSEQGQLQGGVNCIFGIAGMIGPALFNKTFAFVVVSTSVPIIGAPFWLAAGFLMVSAGVALQATRQARRPVVATAAGAAGA
jgi:DHA1 family tetracycline resistance protein-like MFS transporter